MAARRIGEILVSQGALTEAAVNRALGFQRVSGDRIKLGTILLNWDLLEEERLLAALARHHRVPAVPWSVLSSVPIEVTRLVPGSMAIRLGALPYAATATRIEVAFVDPTNLAAQDEIAAITSRRVVPAVALEIRVLQAQQKFYGHHLPIAYRSIVQKIDRRSTATTLLDPRPPVDFRARDLVQSQTLPPAEGRTSSATRIPIARPAPPRFDIPAIAIPEMPMPTPPPRVPRPAPEPEDLSDTKPTTGSAPPTPSPRQERLSDTNPIGQMLPEPGEKLTERMGQAFAALSHGAAPAAPPAAADAVERIDYQPESSDDTRPNRRRARRREDHAPRPDVGDDTLPRGASAHRGERDAVADMWRPGPEDESAPRDWASTAAELEASTGEARNRDEIGQVALEAFLSSVPRVLLLGCGKSVITGWQGRGKRLSVESVAAIRIPLDGHNVFASVRDTGVPHFGPLEPAQWPEPLRATLGGRAPDCAVFPIRVLDGFAAFLYADRLGSPMHYEDFAVIARAAAATSNALARFLLRRNNPAPVR